MQAAHWLEQLIETNKEMKAMKQLGLLLCDCIHRNHRISQVTESIMFQVPRIQHFVCMSRPDILKFTNMAILVSPDEWNVSDSKKCIWAKVFGGTALSYARMGDLQVVAALVRLAAHFNLDNPWLDESEMFLLDQQQEDGSFGLLSSEFALMKDNPNTQHCLLRLTVEVLWALNGRSNLLS